MSDFWDMFGEAQKDPELDVFQTDLERAEYLQRILTNQSTNDGPADNEHYILLRKYFLSKPELKELIPSWLRTNRDLFQFWQFIKQKFPTYAERRRFILDEFSPLLDSIELTTQIPHENILLETLKEYNSEYLLDMWNKTLLRRNTDPDGTITSAKSLLESILKHILDDLEIQYGKNPDLHELYKIVSDNLQLSSSQHEEEVFRQILGGCSRIVSGMGRLRNVLGDAHGQGRKSYRATPRHAQFATNIACSMALFLLETYNCKK